MKRLYGVPKVDLAEFLKIKPICLVKIVTNFMFIEIVSGRKYPATDLNVTK